MPESPAPMPDFLHPEDRVVCFDGVCKVCGFWAKYINEHEPAGLLKLCALQTDEGRALSAWCGLPPGEMNTMIFIDKGKPYFKSSAALRVLMYLRFPHPFISVFLIVPGFIRNWIYDRLALNRYSLFGKEDVCMMPTPELKKRYLK
ncbi:MAG: DCC1-like thiol-disulfide oxidoreductase family protein [Planctomycetota bacterium]